MSKTKANATSFRPGRAKTGGRRAGVSNKKTRFLQEAILIAVETAGNEKGKDGLIGYLKRAAINQTASYLTLLGHIMPQQVETKQTSHTEIVYHSVAEIRQELIQRGVPLDTILELLTDKTDEENPGEQQH